MEWVVIKLLRSPQSHSLVMAECPNGMVAHEVAIALALLEAKAVRAKVRSLYLDSAIERAEAAMAAPFMRLQDLNRQLAEHQAPQYIVAQKQG